MLLAYGFAAITSFKWFSAESVCSITNPTCQLLTNDGQQSFAQEKDKVAACEWRYKHSLTLLECYEYASRTKQLQDTLLQMFL